MSDITIDITDNGNDIGNSNNSNDKNIVVDNASSSHGNNRNIISNIARSTILVDKQDCHSRIGLLSHSRSCRS